MQNDYDYYRARLAGQRPKWSEAEPQCVRARHFSGDPVAIWRDKEGNLCAHKNGQIVSPNTIWPSVAEHCVSEADYKVRMSTGEWPGSEPHQEQMRPTEAPAGLGHNSAAAPDEFTQLCEDAEDRITQAEKLLFAVGDAIQPGDTETATKLKDAAEFLASKHRPLEEMRKAEKKPHDDAAAAVQAKFKPILDRLEIAKRKLLARVDAFVRAEDRRRQEEHRRAQAEAAKKAAEAQEASAAPVAVAEIIAPEPVKVGTIGSKRGVRKPKMTAEITDWAAALSDPLVMEDAGVRAAVQALANKLAGINAAKPWFKAVEVV